MSDAFSPPLIPCDIDAVFPLGLTPEGQAVPRSLLDAVMAKHLGALGAFLDSPQGRAHLSADAPRKLWLPLAWAIELTWSDGVRELLRAGADPLGRPSHGRRHGTPLLEAAQRGSWPVAEHLLDAGADIDATDDWGNSALHVAALRCASMIPLLLGRLATGPAIDRLNQEGMNALAILARRDQAEAIEAMIRHGAHVDAVQHHGFAPLIVAAAYKSNRALAALLAHGADACFEGVQGATALSLSIELDNAAAAEAIMDAGVDPRRKNSKGVSPADIAARWIRGKDAEAAEAALRRAAALDLRDSLAAELPAGPRPCPSPSL